MPSPKYLNDLTFAFTFPRNDATAAFWSFTCEDHRHPQWTTLPPTPTTQFTTMHIKQLCDQWMEKTSNIYVDTKVRAFEFTMPKHYKRLYEAARDAETELDSTIYRTLIDHMLSYVEWDISQQIFSAETKLCSSFIDRSDHYMSWIKQFRKAFQ